MIDCAVFLERRPLLLLAREGKIIRMERETKHRLRRQWASNLTKTFTSDAQTGSDQLEEDTCDLCMDIPKKNEKTKKTRNKVVT